MTYSLLRESIKVWPRNEIATRQQINTLRRGWIKARLWLGDKWLLAKPVERKVQ